MDIYCDDTLTIRIKLNDTELKDLVEGERLFIDIDQALQIEIFHSPDAKYDNLNYLYGDFHDN